MAKVKKVGDVVGWTVVDREGHPADCNARSRESARDWANYWNKEGPFPPYRIAKVVLAK